ncbi:UNVERIFIED_CONTAM: hypothetical protein FKN15_030735 [Acipenser sinensis]
MAQWRAAVFILVSVIAMATAITPGCKIRITAKGLELWHPELSDLGTLPRAAGKSVRITELNLTSSDLRFQPDFGLVFEVHNSSISLNFMRRIFYWFFTDAGSINASAEGVNIHTAVRLSKDSLGRLKISNISCDAAVGKMRAEFSGTLRRVYDLLATFITTGMRFLLNQQICPVLNNAGLVLLNSVLDTVPVRTKVDKYVGIDYSLLNDPVVTSENLDMDFRLTEYDRMVYLSLSEYFFDSGMLSYFKAGVLNIRISHDKICPVLNNAGLVLLNSVLDTVPVRTKVDKYVGIDYSLLNDPVVTSENLDMDFRGFIMIGANLHFSKGLREVIERNRAEPKSLTN